MSLVTVVVCFLIAGLMLAASLLLVGLLPAAGVQPLGLFCCGLMVGVPVGMLLQRLFQLPRADRSHPTR